MIPSEGSSEILFSGPGRDGSSSSHGCDPTSMWSERYQQPGHHIGQLSSTLLEHTYSLPDVC